MKPRLQWILSKPTLLSDTLVTQVVTARDGQSTQLFACTVQVILNCEAHHARFLVEHGLALGVHFCTLLLVEFHTRSDQNLVEFSAGVVGVVPRVGGPLAKVDVNWLSMVGRLPQ